MSMFLDAILFRCTKFYIMIMCRPMPSDVLIDLMNWCEGMPQDYLQISGTSLQSHVSSECLITCESGYRCQSSKIDKLLRCHQYPALGPFIYMTPCHQPRQCQSSKIGKLLRCHRYPVSHPKLTSDFDVINILPSAP